MSCVQRSHTSHALSLSRGLATRKTPCYRSGHHDTSCATPSPAVHFAALRQSTKNVHRNKDNILRHTHSVRLMRMYSACIQHSVCAQYAACRALTEHSPSVKSCAKRQNRLFSQQADSDKNQEYRHKHPRAVSLTVCVCVCVYVCVCVLHCNGCVPHWSHL